MFSSRQVWRREATLFQKAYGTWVYNYRPSASLFCGEAVWYVRLRFLHLLIFGFIFILTDSFIPFVKDCSPSPCRQLWESANTCSVRRPVQNISNSVNRNLSLVTPDTGLSL
jgi:hypothetical protein